MIQTPQRLSRVGIVLHSPLLERHITPFLKKELRVLHLDTQAKTEELRSTLTYPY